MADSQNTNSNLATPWLRMVATAIDYILATVVNVIVVLPFGAVSALTAYQSVKVDDPASFAALNAANAGSGLLAGVLALVVWAVFFVVIPIYLWNGQTVGKKILSLRIVKSNGSHVEQMDIFKRYSIPFGLTVVALIPVLACIACARPILAIVNVVMMFADAKRQTVYDKVADTIVVQE